MWQETGSAKCYFNSAKKLGQCWFSVRGNCVQCSKYIVRSILFEVVFFRGIHQEKTEEKVDVQARESIAIR